MGWVGLSFELRVKRKRQTHILNPPILLQPTH